MKHQIELIKPNSFDPENHYYTKVLNAQIHPLISYFFSMTKEALIQRYCHLNPKVKKEKLAEMINYCPKFLKWSGADLFYVTTDSGKRKMVLLETNSSPSGQKSMPLLSDDNEMGGYKLLIENAFLPCLKKVDNVKGRLAVIYDKNYMEASGYAATLAEIIQQEVFLVPFFNETNSVIRFNNGFLEVNYKKKWFKIKGAFRYVTQKPWTKIPLNSKTIIFNPILSCLSGGRNKMIAAKAYDLFNAKLQGSGLKILTPETINDVSKEEIPLLVDRFGGHAVIKIPYSNAGQGIFTITNKNELNKFMQGNYNYKKFIVQSLIGNSNWTSINEKEKYYHIGTIPNKIGSIYVADLRLMLISTSTGLKPIVMYARRAVVPLVDKLNSSIDSWNVLGTNLSIKEDNNSWKTDTSRLIIMDRKDFNKLGIGIDDLIEAYVQSVLATVAIDKMAKLLMKNNKFNIKLFKSLNNDDQLIKEITL